MLGDFPKLLDRHFLLGYFLPAALMAVGIFLTLIAHDEIRVEMSIKNMTDLSGAFIAVGGIWILAMVLAATNYNFIRLLEGYPIIQMIRFSGRIDPLLRQWLERKIKKNFELNILPILEVYGAIEKMRAEKRESPDTPPDFAIKLYDSVNNYPDKIDHVLPTKFGNCVRSFEIYSRAIYGIDAVAAWPRLLIVMPQEAREIIADARTKLDFCVNIMFASCAVTAVYFGLCIWNFSTPWLLLGVSSIVFGCFGYSLAFAAAREFGFYVRSAFDLYRTELAAGLGLDLPDSAEDERLMWTLVSRMMIYRSAASAAELSQFRARKGSQ